MYIIQVLIVIIIILFILFMLMIKVSEEHRKQLNKIYTLLLSDEILNDICMYIYLYIFFKIHMCKVNTDCISINCVSLLFIHLDKLK